jgi:uncharacterized protein (DUF433 family)
MQTQASPQTSSRAKARRKVAPTYDRHIIISPGIRGGKPHIIGRRITVSDVATWYLDQHRSVDEIVRDFKLTPAQVHAALAYYYDHQAEIQQREAEEFAEAEAMKRNYPSKLQAKLINRG